MLARIVRRFVPGTSMGSAIKTSRKLNAKGIFTTMDILLASPKTMEDAREHVSDYISLVNHIRKEGLISGISVKLTTLGLLFGYTFCEKNLEKVVAYAMKSGVPVTIDMEEFEHKAQTIRIFEKARRRHPNLSITIQACLHDSANDVKELLKMNASIRLVKGVYKEPHSVAYQKKEDIDKSYVKIAKLLLGSKIPHAFATHDEKMINFVKRYAKKKNVSKRMIEFQTLYGVKKDIPLSLSKQGYSVRVYVPYGKDWVGYFHRRLREKQRWRKL